MSAALRIAAVVLWTIVLLAVILYGAPFVQQYAQANQVAITALSALVVAIFTVALTWFAYTQATITKEALVTNKRAFVFPVTIDNFWEFDQNTQHYNWRFPMRWKNSGDTPTRHLRIFTECELRISGFATGHPFNLRDPDSVNQTIDPSVEGTPHVVPGVLEFRILHHAEGNCADEECDRI